jgi:hypothetical protein
MSNAATTSANRIKMVIAIVVMILGPVAEIIMRSKF